MVALVLPCRLIQLPPTQTLYADTPIDASLLSLYIHQNYTQYCTTLDECDTLMDSLNWVDSSGGENVRHLLHFLLIVC